MKTQMTGLQRLALDVYNGKQVMFNEVKGEEAIRNAINVACGGEFNYKNFRENKYKVFSIIEEVLDVTLGVVITNQFDSLAEVKNVAIGERPAFRVDDNSLFRIARIAGGTNDLRRQKILNRRFEVETDYFGAKIYAELEQFQAGMVDFTGWVNRLSLSFAHDLGTQIYKAIASSYSALNSTYGVTGTYSEDELFEMIEHVEAKSGKKAVVMGTRKALRKVSKSINMSDSMKDAINRVGYVGEVGGTSLMLLPQAHKIGTDEFFVDDNMLLVLPSNEKLVKVVVEGEATMIETADAGERNDQQMEYQIQKKMGVGVMQSAIYGIYKIS
ncbi:hypothetical protein CN984_12365 [Bacillus cereus]|uniref:Uncharacterized protein n=1 Tax=Bacillus cereus TaxID=1396 RepID=A0A2A7FNR1_BACCE|nr:hypothetical protein [Bacillus cereus]PEA25799.1 hypothetical protein CON44_17730 [Bacillus cereus]PGO29220.1 hypothetical protein CN984_12365 [Bacillus cereus]